MNTAPVREAPTLRRRGWMPVAGIVLACVVVFVAHFRPWEVGYLEEWPLAGDWRSGGGAFAADYLEWTLSRPLHLIPSLLGLLLGGGSPIGIFAVLAVVAVLQFLAVLWALRPVSGAVWVNASVALFLALHPLWPGGFLQRFLAAQTAALAVVLAVGMLIRWLREGRARWIVAAFATAVIGLAVYPGPAAAAPLTAVVVVLAVRRSTWPRRIVAVAGMTAAAALITLYSLVIARLISPDGTSYEWRNIEVAGVTSVRQLAELVLSTLRDAGGHLIAAVILIAALAALLVAAGRIPASAAWLMAGAAVVSPLTTIVYFGHVGWLVDIDRLGYVISLGLFAALLVWPIARTGRGPRLEAVLATLMVTATLVGAVQGVRHWQPAIELQHRLLEELGPVVREAHDEDDVVSVVDRSRTFGLMATFPLQYLGSASVVWNDDDTLVWLCFPEPDLVPSGGTLCDPGDTGEDPRLVKTIDLPSGTVDIYVGRKESDD